MNFSFSLSRTPFFERGCKDTHYFLTSKFFELFFQENLFRKFSAPVFLRTFQPHQPPVFQMGVQRYDFLINFQIFPTKSMHFFTLFSALKSQFIDNQADRRKPIFIYLYTNCKLRPIIATPSPITLIYPPIYTYI